VPRFAEGNLDKNLAVVDALTVLARQKGCTTAQLALAWVLAQGDDVVPIPGARQRKNLEDNCGAVEVDLSPNDLARIEAVAPKGAAAGERYDEGRMARLNA
jgi:aryl-alcohol dehydrogenase-like predicted oxidoreductase